MDPSIEEKIRHRAYELWERWGRPDSGAETFWRLAEDEIVGRDDDVADDDQQRLE